MEDIFASSDSVRNANQLAYAQYAVFKEPLSLEQGGVLPEITVAYETYGELSPRRDNAILICHALSGDSHVAKHNESDDDGWWEIMVGPDKPIDTNKFFVICPNSLGGCRGSTGPSSVNPATGKQYDTDFPSITIGDIVEVQRKLLDHLGIYRLLAAVGSSLGGLMVLEWTTRFPDRVTAAIPVATAARLTSQALAFDIVARNAIQSDPNFRGGKYHEAGVVPADGLAIARMLGHITYLSREAMMKKFDASRNVGRPIDSKFETKFSVGSYLAHQGGKFVERFDANTYLTLSMAIDMYNLGNTHEELTRALRRSMCRWLILCFSTDWLFPSFLSQELVDALLAEDKRVSFCNVQSDCGHDAFLLPNEFAIYGEMIRGFLTNVAMEQMSGERPRFALSDRVDYTRIIDLIPRGAKVLDLGCGKGGLLARLRQCGHDRVMGVEISERYLLTCIQRGLDVVQADLNNGFRQFKDDQFDFVILSKTLQTIKNVEFVLDEVLRVGTRAIVSFPNFGYHAYRRKMYEEGRTPSIRHNDKQAQWYDTSDVRVLTLADFEEFCSKKNYRIHQIVAIDTITNQPVTDQPNENADVVIVVLS